MIGGALGGIASLQAGIGGGAVLIVLLLRLVLLQLTLILLLLRLILGVAGGGLGIHRGVADADLGVDLGSLGLFGGGGTGGGHAGGIDPLARHRIAALGKRGGTDEHGDCSARKSRFQEHHF